MPVNDDQHHHEFRQSSLVLPLVPCDDRILDVGDPFYGRVGEMERVRWRGPERVSDFCFAVARDE